MQDNLRILIFGGMCSGKSHFTRLLQDALALEAWHLDDLFWFGDWENIGPEALKDEALRIAGSENGWIIDGNYRQVREALYPLSTHVYFCYQSLPVLFWRAFKRSRSKTRAGVPAKVRDATAGREPFFAMAREIWRYRFGKRNSELAFCREIQQGGVNAKILKMSTANIQREISALTACLSDKENRV